MKSQNFAQNRKKPKQKFRFWGPDVLLGPAAAVFRAAGTSKPRILTRASRSTRQFLFAPEALNEKGISVWIEARHRFVKTSVFPARPMQGIVEVDAGGGQGRQSPDPGADVRLPESGGEKPDRSQFRSEQDESAP